MGKLDTTKLVALTALTAAGVATGGFGLLGAGAAAAGTAGATGAAATGAAEAAAATGAATGAASSAAATGAGVVAEKAAETGMMSAVKGFMSKYAVGESLLAGGSVYKAGSAKIDADYQNSLLKSQEKQDYYNAQMEQEEGELDLAIKEKEIQKNLANTLATQTNIFGAQGRDPALGGTSAQMLQAAKSQADRDEQFLNSSREHRKAAFYNNNINRTLSYQAARRNNKSAANSAALGSLLDFGVMSYGLRGK